MPERAELKPDVPEHDLADELGARLIVAVGMRYTLAIPGRPLYRNSTSVYRIPTATISRAPSSSASSSATSSLVPGAGHCTESRPSDRTRSRPGAVPSG